MSSTNKTANYKLSQFIGTDKPTFLGDYNNDMQIIDKAIFDTNQSAEQAVNDVESVKGAQEELKTVHTETQKQVQQLKETADEMSGNVTAAQESANNAEEKATEAQNAATGVVNAANTASANATKAKQTADANKTTLTELESRVSAIEATPKLDDISFNLELGGWRPNLSGGSVSNKYIFETGGRNQLIINTTKVSAGGNFYYADGVGTSGTLINTIGTKTITLKSNQVVLQFTQESQSNSQFAAAITIKKV